MQPVSLDLISYVLEFSIYVKWSHKGEMRSWGLEGRNNIISISLNNWIQWPSVFVNPQVVCFHQFLHCNKSWSEKITMVLSISSLLHRSKTYFHFPLSNTVNHLYRDQSAKVKEMRIFFVSCPRMMKFCMEVAIYI